MVRSEEPIGPTESDALSRLFRGHRERKRTMAVIHPQDRIAHLRADRHAVRRPLHPALGLAVGFGFIFVAATIVHVVFNAVM